MFVAGCCVASPSVQKRYIISAAPFLCFAVVFIPISILIAMKVGMDDIYERIHNESVESI